MDSRQVAINEWNTLAKEVEEAGYGNLAKKHRPIWWSGEKRIKAATDALRSEYEKKKGETK